MRMLRSVRSRTTAAALAAAAALLAAGGLNPAQAAAPAHISADTSHTLPQTGKAGTGGIARPRADDPASRGAVAPIVGTVPGLTGKAAQRAAGGAADRFRQLTEQRTHAATAQSSAARTTRTAPAQQAAPAAPAAQLHTDWGVNLPNGASKGLQATQSVVGGAKATHGGDYVYAPTAIPAGGACMEMTTAYTPDGPDLWAWDWCGGRDGVGKLTPMDSTFLSTYTTTVNGRPAYSLDIHQTAASTNTWSAYLYNYRTHVWDTYFTSSGTYDLPQFSFGWDMFEVYTSVNPATGAGYYCQDMAGQTFESSSIKVLSGSTWTPAVPGNSTPDSTPPPAGSRLDCPSLQLSLAHQNDHWTGHIG